MNIPVLSIRRFRRNCMTNPKNFCLEFHTSFAEEAKLDQFLCRMHTNEQTFNERFEIQL